MNNKSKQQLTRVDNNLALGDGAPMKKHSAAGHLPMHSPLSSPYESPLNSGVHCLSFHQAEGCFAHYAHSSGAVPLVSSAVSSAGWWARFGSSCTLQGGKLLVAGVLAANLAQCLAVPQLTYAQGFTPEVPSGDITTVTDEEVRDGQTQNVRDGGTTIRTTIYGNGTQNVYGGGVASGTIISGTSGDTSGTLITAVQNVHSGGKATDSIVNSAGVQNVFNGATISGGEVMSGGLQRFVGQISPANQGGTTLNSGASQAFANGAIASSGGIGGTVANGVTQIIEDGGLAVSVVVASGGSQRVSSGGVTSRTIIDHSLGGQYISSGGIASGTFISAGQQIISSGGSAVDAIVFTGAVQHVSSGMTLATTVNTSGVQNVYTGGTASGTTVNDAGTQNVFDGGVTADAAVTNGVQNVSSGGSAVGTVISSGVQNLFSGSAWDTIVKSDGVQNISGGTAVDTIVSSGGSQVIINGGVASATTILTGGTQHLWGGTITGGNATFNSGTIFRGQGGTVTGDLVFNGGIFTPVLDHTSPQGNIINVSGSVQGTSGATIAPVWAKTGGVPDPDAFLNSDTVQFTVLVSDKSLGGTFIPPEVLVGYTYAQKLTDDAKTLLLEVTSRDANLEKYTSSLAVNPAPLAPLLDGAFSGGQLPGLGAAIKNLPANGTAVNGALEQLTAANPANAQITGNGALQKHLTNMLLNGNKPINTPATGEGSDWTFFATPFGMTASQDSTRGFAGYDMYGGGLSLGAVQTIDNKWWGLAGGFSHQKTELDGLAAETQADQLSFTVFGGLTHGNFFTEAALGYAHTWNDSSRYIDIGSGATRFAGTLNADYGQNSFLASLKTGYIWRLQNGVSLTPSIGLNYVYGATESYSENGAGAIMDAALNLQKSNFTSIQVPVEIEVKKTYEFQTFNMTPSFSLGWIPELGDTFAVNTANFVNAPTAGTFQTVSQTASRHTFAAGAGVEMQFDNFDLTFDYDFNTRENFQAHGVTMNLKWSF